jgi:hypothetical protein
MYHIVLHHIKEGWREAHLKLAHSHSHLFTYLIQFNNVDYSGGGDGREDGMAWTRAAVTAKQTVWFSGTAAMTVEAVWEADGEAAAWSQWQRRSRIAWFLGVVMVWSQSRLRQCGLSGVEEGTRNFGGLTVSKSKSSS